MFSPYYAFARRRGPADPENHVALNIALYGARQNRWAMTERPRGALLRDASTLQIGPSVMRWDGARLIIQINERAVPHATRLRGIVTLEPEIATSEPFSLTPDGSHQWQPIAPRARVSVAMERPALRWEGAGYFDHNAGNAPLERDFVSWTWSRCDVEDGAAILYESVGRGVNAPPLALRFLRDGTAEVFDLPPHQTLQRTRWRMNRETRGDGAASVIRTLEDAPFYTRSILDTHLLGARRTAMHESLSLDRFRMPVVQAMLPFRMPRARR